MDVTFRMGVVQGRQQVTADLAAAGDRQRPVQPPDPVEGVHAVDVLHDQLKLRVRLVNLVERHDARMTLAAWHQQVAQNFDLSAEITAGFLAHRGVGADHLDGDRAAPGELAAAKTSPMPPPPIHSSIR